MLQLFVSPMRSIRICFLAGIFAFPLAHAEIPDDFHALVVKPAFSFFERVIDLTPALEKSKQVGKPLLIYLGAADCPPCKEYTIFLRSHIEEMKPALSEYVLVDIRTWLKGPKLFFMVNGQKLTYAEFKSFVGDANRAEIYPAWWLLSSEGKQIRQLPSGNTKFLAVESHLRLIKPV